MRQYFSALAMIAVTTVVVAGAQIITTKAAAERRAVTKLNIELVETTVRIRELEAELGTRAGMPELQRWNDAVFQLSAPQGAQILHSPVQLAGFAAQPDGAPRVQFAIAGSGLPIQPPAAGAAAPGAQPAPATQAGARVVQTSFEGQKAPYAAPYPANETLQADDLAALQPQGGAS